jgi:hypothetical protein
MKIHFPSIDTCDMEEWRTANLAEYISICPFDVPFAAVGAVGA